ncbi:MAG TPA: hemin receptor [Burkholderiales bacterium]
MPRQVELLQQSWRSVLPVGDLAAELFYGKLFSLDPKIRLLFRNDMKDQGRNLTALISVAVGGLEVALLWMLKKCLGEAFTPEVRQAWAAAYELLAGTMKLSCSPRDGAP